MCWPAAPLNHRDGTEKCGRTRQRFLSKLQSPFSLHLKRPFSASPASTPLPRALAPVFSAGRMELRRGKKKGGGGRLQRVRGTLQVRQVLSWFCCSRLMKNMSRVALVPTLGLRSSAVKSESRVGNKVPCDLQAPIKQP